MPPQSESIAGRARQMAERSSRLAEDVRACFKFADANQRIRSIQDAGVEIVIDMSPVFSWLERRRPPDKAALVRARLDAVLTNAVRCAGLEIPEFAGGKAVPIIGKPSHGVQRAAALKVTAMLVAAYLGDWANDIEAEDKEQPPPLPPAPTPPTIWHHGGNTYSRDGFIPYVVTAEESSILGAFQKVGTAMETRDLETKSGSTNVARTIAQLRSKYGGVFADAIRTPGAKGTGGYFIRVRPAVP